MADAGPVPGRHGRPDWARGADRPLVRLGAGWAALTRAARSCRGARHGGGADCIDDTTGSGPARPGGVGASGDGPSDVRDVPAGLHVRPCPPARSRRRSGDRAGLEAGSRTDRDADRRRGLHDLRGARPPEAGRRLRLHRVFGLPPAVWPPGPTPARCSTPGCAKAIANTARGSCGSSTSSWPASSAGAGDALSCGPTRASTRTGCWTGLSKARIGLQRHRSPSGPVRAASTPSPSGRGSASTTPTARPTSPSASTGDGG